jgi:hypothetical protein
VTDINDHLIEGGWVDEFAPRGHQNCLSVYERGLVVSDEPLKACGRRKDVSAPTFAVFIWGDQPYV